MSGKRRTRPKRPPFWCIDGAPVWYWATPSFRFQAVVDGWPWLDDTTWFVRLRDVESRLLPRRTKAAVSVLEPIVVDEEQAEPASDATNETDMAGALRREGYVAGIEAAVGRIERLSASVMPARVDQALPSIAAAVRALLHPGEKGESTQSGGSDE